jgi:hypothetical protein
MADYASAEAARAALSDPGLSQTDLAAIAAGYPELRAQAAVHPQAYDGLLGWLNQVGDDHLKAIVAARRAAPPASATLAGAAPVTPAAPVAPAVTPAAVPADTAVLPTYSQPTPTAPDSWMAPAPLWSSADPGQPVGFQAGDPYAASYPDPNQTGPLPTTPLIPVTYGAPTTTPPPKPKKGGRIALAVGGVALAGALVAGGIALFGGGGPGGPPTLNEEQFVVLAQDTLPEEANLPALRVDTNSSNPGIIAQFCRSMSDEGIEADADGRVDLTLFDTPERALAFVEGLTSCMATANDIGITETEGVTVDGVYIVELKVFGISLGEFAQYGNVVVSSALWNGSWETFAIQDFKVAVDKAAD